MTDVLIYPKLFLTILRNCLCCYYGDSGGKQQYQPVYANIKHQHQTTPPRKLLFGLIPLAFLNQQSSKRGQIREYSHPLTWSPWQIMSQLLSLKLCSGAEAVAHQLT